MKYLIIAIVSLAGSWLCAMPSSNNFVSVTNDWYNGNFSNVYELAQARLSANTNDVVGAYLAFDCDLAFSDLMTISNSIQRLIRNSDLTNVPAFTNVYAVYRNLCISFRDEFLPSKNENERALMQHKDQPIHGALPSEAMLELMWENGLW